MWERLSYFITAVAAVLGWLITHYVDRVTQTPTIEYTISEQSAGSGLSVSYQLTNVNRAQAFGPIQVRFIATRESPITHRMRVVPREPASEGQGRVITQPGSAQFELPRMLPGQSYRFVLDVAGSDQPHLYLSSANPGETVRFTRRSLETWIATNETQIVVALILFWIVVLAGLIGFAIFSRAPKPAAESSTG